MCSKAFLCVYGFRVYVSMCISMCITPTNSSITPTQSYATLLIPYVKPMRSYWKHTSHCEKRPETNKYNNNGGENCYAPRKFNVSEDGPGCSLPDLKVFSPDSKRGSLFLVGHLHILILAHPHHPNSSLTSHHHSTLSYQHHCTIENHHTMPSQCVIIAACHHSIVYYRIMSSQHAMIRPSHYTLLS